jgi:hypothetical protein
MEETDFSSIKGCLALRGNLQMNNRFFLIDIKICCGLGLVYMNCIKKIHLFLHHNILFKKNSMNLHF